jgi:hypothetical protein
LLSPDSAPTPTGDKGSLEVTAYRYSARVMPI